MEFKNMTIDDILEELGGQHVATKLDKKVEIIDVGSAETFDDEWAIVEGLRTGQLKFLYDITNTLDS